MKTTSDRQIQRRNKIYISKIYYLYKLKHLSFENNDILWGQNKPCHEKVCLIQTQTTMVQPGFSLGYVFQGADQLRHPGFSLGYVFQGADQLRHPGFFLVLYFKV